MGRKVAQTDSPASQSGINFLSGPIPLLVRYARYYVARAWFGVSQRKSLGRRSAERFAWSSAAISSASDYEFEERDIVFASFFGIGSPYGQTV